MALQMVSTDSAEAVTTALADPGKDAGASSADANASKTTPDSDTGDTTSADAGASKTTPDSDTGEKDAGGKSKLDKKIDKLTKEAGEKAREAEFWRQEALKNRTTEPDKKPDTKPDAPATRPTADDFKTHNDFIEALTTWKAEQAVDARDKKRDDTAKEASQRERDTQTQKAWQERYQASKERYPDIDEVLADDEVDLGTTLFSAIMESEVGPDVAYFLVQNPGEVRRIKSMSEGQQLREMGRLEARFLKAQDEKEPAKDEKPVKKPKPAPINPLKGEGKGKVEKTLEDEDISFQEWKKLREKQLREKRGR